MPFYYDLKLPDSLSIAEVRGHLVPARNMLEPDTPVALLRSDGKSLLLRVAGRGFLREWFVRPGDVVRAGQAIARMDADGDEIPYGRPYVRLEAWTGE